MRIEPSGVVLTGVCEVQTAVCQALKPAAITAVWAVPARTQINVCRACLEEKVRDGEWEIPGARIQQRADAAVYSADGELMLVVEVKSNPPAGREAATLWAEKIHRNLIVHAGVPGAPYFMLVGYPRSFFLWRQPFHAGPSGEPDEIHFGPLLEPYCGEIALPGTEEGYEQERIVSRWLEESVHGDHPSAPDAAPAWLQRLFNELSGGTVVRQTPVFA
ncbi:hypothetical protein SAMN05216486_11418 [bacterium JGI 053]|nr:hypothetical protein SAMN05216486_11418 [bacterium JGI 053]